MDIKTPEARSKNMAAMKSRDTKPELRLRRGLWNAGMRFFTPGGWAHLTGHQLPGRPDLIFPSARAVLFVDGCFWHGCPEHYHAPANRSEFWSRKLHENKLRDERSSRMLSECGWMVIRIWEHELNARKLPETVARLKTILKPHAGDC